MLRHFGPGGPARFSLDLHENSMEKYFMSSHTHAVGTRVSLEAY